LPGPLEDGLMLQVIGAPRLHPRFGFSINIHSLQPVGKGSIKKAADLLKAKLEAEGLFAPERKRPLPAVPQTIGLITAAGSAAYHDFVKILNERWGGVEVSVADVYVQGAQAPGQIVRAIEYFNGQPALADVLVLTRGGGSAEDLAAFNDERVVRAVAASRVPTLVAIGHEVDISLAELAADTRASTPSNAAQLVVPGRAEAAAGLRTVRSALLKALTRDAKRADEQLNRGREYLTSQVILLLENLQSELTSTSKLLGIFDPRAALKRGYAIVSKSGRRIASVKGLKTGDSLGIQLADGTISAKVADRL
jgi:exodeoxyribonuclease VII large subunit